MAIVAHNVYGERHYVALACVETPEVRFEDVLVVPFGSLCGHDQLRNIYIVDSPIDPVFLAVCESDTVAVVSAVPSTLARVGAYVEDSCVRLESDTIVPYITLKLSGIRKGHNWRFRRHTREEMEANLKFWNQWKGNTTC